ncbi:MAG: CRTAC1 family protein [Acidobacteriota bacterium]
MSSVLLVAACSPGADDHPGLSTTEAHGAPDAVSTATAAAPRWTDVTDAAGIDFVHTSGARGDKLLPETMGGGVAFLDFDRDGAADLFFVDSAPWPAETGTASDSATADLAPPSSSGPRLFLGDGAGGFRDATEASGLRALFAPTRDEAPFYGMGLAIGDVDADGRLDVFLAGLGQDRLLRGVASVEGDGVDGRGDGSGPRFVDATADAGVGGGARWSTGAAFADFDGDGWLDLAVARYVRWSRAVDLQLDFDVARGARGYRPPFSFEGLHPTLYRNRGDGTFEDVSAAWGVEVVLNEETGTPASKALAVLPVDVDGDGDLDLFVANDTTPNLLLRNDVMTRDDPAAPARFVEIGVEAGVAFAPNGMRTGAMGVDFGHRPLDHPTTTGAERELSLAVGNFARETTSLFVARPQRGVPTLFDDLAAARGLAAATTPALTFGLLYLDADLDGDLDLLQANGHIEPDIARVEPEQSYEQPAQLFLAAPSDTGMRYALVPDEALGDLATPRVGRGAAAADMDGDGDLDLVITQIDRRPALLRNELLSTDRAPSTPPHWLRVQLHGTAPNLDAIGAEVLVETADGRRQWRTVQPARSYLSAIELPVTFGLGVQDRVTRLVVRWPDGSTTERRDLGVDRVVVVRQDGDG